ncbi:hypothetical protein ACFQZE_22420 [Paenibacillus sp. GCM10027627]|uniref:hypothetical protein n=1 Tax=unclassified Paenibacillus TaxID=185978 RepID=UPI00363600D5
MAIRYLSLMILVVILLTGCASAGSSEKVNDSGKVGKESSASGGQGDPFADIAAADVQDKAAALDEMSSLIKTFKQAVESDEREEAIKQAEQLASYWKAVSSDVLAEQPERHEQLNGEIGQLLTGVRAKEWDKTLLVDLDYSLYQGVRDLKQASQ